MKKRNAKLIKDGQKRKLTNPGLEDDEMLAGAEILSRKKALPAGDKRHILGEDRIVEQYFGKNPKKARGIASPEGLIANRNGKLTAFEVKNQKVPDVDHALKKFDQLFDSDSFSSSIDKKVLSQRQNSIGRLDLYTPSGAPGSAEGILPKAYQINKQGLLTKTVDGKVTIPRFGPNKLPVHVIQRDLPIKGVMQ